VSPKTLILLPDGVGLRNFIYTDFLSHGDARVWTPLAYLSKELDILELPAYGAHKMTEVYKSALVRAMLINQYEKTGDSTYLSYIFPSTARGLKAWFKRKMIDELAWSFISEKGQERLREHYIASVKKSDYYRACLQQLEAEKPDFVFCTNQRMTNAAAPILAAQALGIPTGTFIFSWDNLPKGNLSVPAEHLFVWSDYMKAEALHYYPFLRPENVHVVGTPQFIPYTDPALRESREDFCARYGLDPEAKLICFSGDDVTTSPYDQVYLEDTARAVRELNAEGRERYQILFRRCPVDFSDRYDKTLETHADIIRCADPLWAAPEGGTRWKLVIPTRGDVGLLVNTVLHCETVINLGSTMAHDFAAMGKTSCYFRYSPVGNAVWDIGKIYRYIHFRSMEGLDPVYWVEDPETIAETLRAAMTDGEGKLPDARKWLETIALQPLDGTNDRIWQTIAAIAGHP